MKKQMLLALLPLIGLWSVSIQAAPSKPDDDFLSKSSSVEESTTNEVRWYQVELLIYKQRPISTEIAEVWPMDITLSYPDNWDTLKTPEEYQTLYQKKAMVNTPFIFLDKKQFQLSSIKSKLQLNRNDIFFHAAWRQSLTQNLDQKGEEKITPILIRGGDRFDDHYELEGSISLSLLRYLHIDTNLWLTRFISASAKPVLPVEENKAEAGEAVIPPPATWPLLPTYPLLKSAAPSAADALNNDSLNNGLLNNNVVAEKKYEVDEIVINKQSRRMRSYETHYIDHPKFGILVRMIPLDTNTMLPIPPKN